MKLYIANGIYVGTQAEAKRLDKAFEQVEVPTDKEGLIAYLNSLIDARSDQCAPDEFEAVVVRQDPPVPPQPSYTAISIAIDEAWEGLALARRLHYAALAVEAARAVCPVVQVIEEGEADDPFA